MVDLVPLSVDTQLSDDDDDRKVLVFVERFADKNRKRGSKKAPLKYKAYYGTLRRFYRWRKNHPESELYAEGIVSVSVFVLGEFSENSHMYISWVRSTRRWRMYVLEGPLPATATDLLKQFLENAS